MLPNLPYTTALRQVYQTQFGGLHHRKGAIDGEIYDMRNLTSDHYPVISPREKRRIMDEVSDVRAVYCYGSELIYVAGQNLYVGGEAYSLPDASKPNDPSYTKDVSIAVVGSIMIVMPYKRYFNLKALNALGQYETLEELESAVSDPGYGDVYYVSALDPSIGYTPLYQWNGKSWVNLGFNFGLMESEYKAKVKFLKQGSYKGTEAYNNAIKSMLASTDFTTLFRVGDAVTIRGAVKQPDNNKTAIVREITKDTLYFYNYAFSLDVARYVSASIEEMYQEEAPEMPLYYYFFADDQWYRFTVADLGEQGYYGTIPKGETLTFEPNSAGTWVMVWSDSEEGGGAYEMPVYAVNADDVPDDAKTLAFSAIYADTEEEDVTISRDVPEMDMIISINNRLWGGKGDTVYGSKLGDPLNFNCFDGISTDSYSAELGTPGDITGIANYNGYPTFFKEDGIFKLYGSYPSAFQIYATATNGVKIGCGKSIAKIGDTLFYVSKNGVVAYAGGIPSYVGDPLGVRISAGVGGSDGRKYFLSAETEEGRLLYVYDTFLGLWHIEDELEAVSMSYGDALICGTADGRILALSFSADGTLEDDFEWYVVFADSVVGSANRKGVEQLQIRADCSGGGWCDAFISFDGGEYEFVGRIEKDGKYSSVLPFVLKRGDTFRVKLTGKGIVDIYSMNYKYYQGSERK